MLRLLFPALMILVLASCQSSQTESDKVGDTATEQQEEEAMNASYFGEKISFEAVQPLNALYEQVGEDSLEIKIKGTVQDVCQAKGCWMNVVSTNKSDEPIMVRFKDYGFFVPKDIAGQEVVIRGKAFKKVTTVEELRHYAEDAGKSKEEIMAITEPEATLGFLADGVIVLE